MKNCLPYRSKTIPLGMARAHPPKALDALDSMAFSAMRLCVLSSANPDRGQGNSALVAALVAEGSSIGGLESEIRVPTSVKVRVKMGQAFAQVDRPLSSPLPFPLLGTKSNVQNHAIHWWLSLIHI